MYGFNSVYFNLFSIRTAIFLTWNMNNNSLILLELPQESVDILESKLGDFSRYFKCLIYLIA